jgi:alpha-amylase
VILSNAGEATLTAELGPDHAGATFVDWLGHAQGECVADDEGRLPVRCAGGSVSVWVRQDAA